MDQEAKGQVGGLDTEEGVRRRLATESRFWSCTGCEGRSNEDIMKGLEDEVKALEKDGPQDGKRAEVVEVPAALRLRYRDELEKTNGNVEDDAPAASFSAAEASTARTCGAVHARDTSTSAVTRTPEIDAESARARTVPNPAPTRTRPPPPAAVAIVPAASNNGVPPWLDRAISGVMACLIFLILKRIMGL